jgi:UDP-3-O-[3-hydroxymyristoyl] N-acetylglucosamine deacetylase/3-hydroxyacyl-[acyl-carrier-protein] dehydratase
MAEKQRTLKAAIKLQGIGLHTGEKVNLEICPAPDNHGYKFQRTDLEGEPIIKADADLVVATDRGTTLEFKGARVYTTEHVLAALYGCQVDNALIKLDGPEVPIMDGSSLLFVRAIEEVGYQDQEAERDYFILT